MLLLYTHPVSARVRYTFNLVFNSLLGIPYQITSEINLFRQFKGVKISYSQKPIEDELFFFSSDLLFETGINPSTPGVLTGTAHSLLNSEKATEKTGDIFALIFFLVSRYEEYLPFTGDPYGRFPAKQSFAYKNNFLHTPLVNIVAKKIKGIISTRHPDFNFPEKKFSYIPTIDIDNAYAYREKNTARTLAGYARALAKADPDDFLKRKNVLSGKEKDPYDTYNFQMDLHGKYSLRPIYFFLLGDWATHDKNLPYTNLKMQELIKNISKNADAGIHPSFASNQRPEKVKIEKNRLEKIQHLPVTKSRQHFLMLQCPQTYRNLINCGITEDYTMGFADETGFRASICSPYKFYDLEKEEETNLTLHPFAVMDGTLNNYLKLTPVQAIEKVKEILKEIKAVNGEFISIWHNETLSNWRDWKGWRDVYEEVLREACLPDKQEMNHDVRPPKKEGRG